jgi:hypothetical protein
MKNSSLLILILFSSCSVYDNRISRFDANIWDRPGSTLIKSDLDSLVIGGKVKIHYQGWHSDIVGGNKKITGHLFRMDSSELMVIHRALRLFESREVVVGDFWTIPYKRINQLEYVANKESAMKTRE